MTKKKKQGDFVRGKSAAAQLRKIADALEASEKLFKIKINLTVSGAWAGLSGRWCGFLKLRMN